MASGWVKSWHCKSRAFDDVYHPNPKHLKPSFSCRRTSQKSIKDVIQNASQKPRKSDPKPGPGKPETMRNPHALLRHSVSAPPILNPDSYLPALSELPEGHPSRNVVEIIFHTGWSPKAFVGQIEMIFKVQQGPRTVARFEEYREMVKARAGLGSSGPVDEENARCVADGNEVMRFHCLGPPTANTGASGRWLFPAGKGAAICTYGGSLDAHESAGGGRGRRAMLVCRVIAGRVSKRSEFQYDSLLDGRARFESVSGDNGELLVHDPHAVLPCFLIIYKL